MEINFSISEKDLIDFHRNSLPGFNVPSLQGMRDDSEDICDVRTEDRGNNNIAEQQESVTHSATKIRVPDENSNLEPSLIQYPRTDFENISTSNSRTPAMSRPMLSQGPSAFFMQKSLVDYSRFGTTTFTHNDLSKNSINFESYFKRRKFSNKNGKKKKSKASKKRLKLLKQACQSLIV